MSVVNSYSPPTAGVPTFGPDPYDLNFCYPVPSTPLETTHIQLVPFIPSIHGQPFIDGTTGHTEQLYAHFPFLLYPLDNLLLFAENKIRKDPGACLWAILDKTRGNALAGIIGLHASSAPNLTTEVGPIIVMPAFQRTHVASHAVGAILRLALADLKLRRIAWQAKPENTASVKAAERMGFKREGTLRWTFVLPEGQEGMKAREGDVEQRNGRHSVFLGVTWEDWANGGKQLVDEALAR